MQANDTRQISGRLRRRLGSSLHLMIADNS